MGLIAEKGIGVEHLVPQILVGGTVKVVGSGLGSELNCAAREPAIVWREVIGFDLKLLQGILCGNERCEVVVLGVDRRSVQVGYALVGDASADLVIAPRERVGAVRIC